MGNRKKTLFSTAMAHGKIYNNIVETVGRTPLVKLNRVAEGVGATILAKCEFFNAGGSVKDRIGRRMLEAAEKSGRIKPGDTLIALGSAVWWHGVGLDLHQELAAAIAKRKPPRLAGEAP